MRGWLRATLVIPAPSLTSYFILNKQLFFCTAVATLLKSLEWYQESSTRMTTMESSLVAGMDSTKTEQLHQSGPAPWTSFSSTWRHRNQCHMDNAGYSLALLLLVSLFYFTCNLLVLHIQHILYMLDNISSHYTLVQERVINGFHRLVISIHKTYPLYDKHRINMQQKCLYDEYQTVKRTKNNYWLSKVTKLVWRR